MGGGSGKKLCHPVGVVALAACPWLAVEVAVAGEEQLHPGAEAAVMVIVPYLLSMKPYFVFGSQHALVLHQFLLFQF